MYVNRSTDIINLVSKADRGAVSSYKKVDCTQTFLMKFNALLLTVNTESRYLFHLHCISINSSMLLLRNKSSRQIHMHKKAVT